MSHWSEHRAGAAALIASPLLLLVAAIVHPSHRAWDSAIPVAADGRGVWYLGHLLVLVAVVLLVPALMGLGQTVRERGRLEYAGGALTIAGAIGLGALVGVELVVWEMSDASLDRGAMEALVERMATSPGLVVPLFTMLGALTLGLCMLALVLERSQSGPPGMALAGGVALAFSIAAFPVPFLSIPTALVALIGLGSVGRTLLDSPASLEHAEVQR